MQLGDVLTTWVDTDAYYEPVGYCPDCSIDICV